MINLSLNLTEASLVLSALRDASSRVNMPQLEAIIDNLNSAYLVAEQDADADERDLFRSDAEADGNALASAGHGTDEDYPPAHDYYNPWEDDGV